MTIDGLTPLIVGIDLGTSTSAIGYWLDRGDSGLVQLVNGQMGRPYISSTVVADVRHTPPRWIAGDTAMRASTHPDSAPYAIPSAKRRLGRERTLTLGPTLTGPEITVTPSEVLSKVLNELSQMVGRLGGFTIGKAVVVVPMIYRAEERELTREAVRLAGIELLDLIEEPTAAAMCYVQESASAFHRTATGDRILVFDMGGGTTDLTLFEMVDTEVTAGKPQVRVDVIWTGGDRVLGGDDIDQFILDHFKNLPEEPPTVPSPLRPRIRVQLMSRIEEFKVQLSNSAHAGSTAPIDFNFDEGGVVITAEMTPAEFTELIVNSAIAARIRAQLASVPLDQPMKRVMMVGGSSRIRAWTTLIGEQFPGVEIVSDVPVQEAVVRGATYRAVELAKATTSATKRSVALRNRGVVHGSVAVIADDPESDQETPVHLLAHGTRYPTAPVKFEKFETTTDTPSLDFVLLSANPSGGSEALGTISLGILPIGTEISIGIDVNGDGEFKVNAKWDGGTKDAVLHRPRPMDDPLVVG